MEFDKIAAQAACDLDFAAIYSNPNQPWKHMITRRNYVVGRLEQPHRGWKKWFRREDAVKKAAEYVHDAIYAERNARGAPDIHVAHEAWRIDRYMWEKHERALGEEFPDLKHGPPPAAVDERKYVSIDYMIYATRSAARGRLAKWRYLATGELVRASATTPDTPVSKTSPTKIVIGAPRKDGATTTGTPHTLPALRPAFPCSEAAYSLSKSTTLTVPEQRHVATAEEE